jgi:hypothetical protein
VLRSVHARCGRAPQADSIPDFAGVNRPPFSGQSEGFSTVVHRKMENASPAAASLGKRRRALIRAALAADPLAKDRLRGPRRRRVASEAGN